MAVSCVDLKRIGMQQELELLSSSSNRKNDDTCRRTLTQSPHSPAYLTLSGGPL